MAAPSWRTDSSLRQRLFEEPFRYGFFQAVRVLHALAPDRSHIGGDAVPGTEAVRFGAEQSTSFPASEILELAERADGEPPEMTVRFMGLTGPLGTLPRHYTELIIDRFRKRDRTLAAFLDLFNHRLVSLFFRAWEKYRPQLRTDPEGRETLENQVLAFIGLGTDGLRNRLTIRDQPLMFYTGLLAQRPRSATALESLLGDYFGDIPVAVRQFIGQWLALEPDSLTSLVPFGGNTRLGVEAVVGSRVWHTQSRFRVRLGPLGYDRFCELLPCGPASPPALALTRFFAGQEFDFDFQLVLRASEVPPCRLGATGPTAPRLGWSTWVTSRPPAADVDDPVFDAEALRAYHQQSMEASQ